MEHKTLFSSFHLAEDLQKSLTRLGFIEPTPIQKQAIPLALKGRDILGSAQTGTGKTGAFVIPIITRMMNSSYGNALILTPTRELAAQVAKVVRDLLPHRSNIRTALLIGGAPMGKQFRELKEDPRIIIGTPGRVNDHLQRKSLSLRHTSFLVLDETDRMLDMGFGVQLDAIAKFLPKERQTMMFSATMPHNIMKLSEKYLNNPERIAIGAAHKVALNIKEEMLHIKPSAKYAQLVKELDNRAGSVIVFVKTKRGADQLADQLCDDEHRADAIHGDLKQKKRDQVIRAFRNKAYRIMVATDVAARGLDIPHIEHVINYDLPQCPEDYIHRIGRTARAGAEGSAMSFVSPQEQGIWKDIHKLMKGEATDTQPAYRAQRPERNGSVFGAKGNDKNFRKKKFHRHSNNGNGGGRSHAGNKGRHG
jgi:ATP-dependent RNA helicase DeaD